MEDRLTRGSPAGRVSREDVFVLSALLALVLITVAWWALALWPATPSAPAWLARTQAVCFGVRANGLPDAAGWTGLIASPLGMFALLFVSGRRAFGRIARQFGRVRWLQAGAVALLLFIAASSAAATVRVRRALGSGAEEILTTDNGTAIRMDRQAPDLALVDQFGATRSLGEFGNRSVLVTFAYAHCETVCPTLVHNAVVAQKQLRAQGNAPVLLIVTLDPVRDTPARLPTLARQWQIGADTYVLSGTPQKVQHVLDAWQVARSYNETNGSVTHVALAYVVAHNRIRYEATAPASELLVQLVDAL